MYLYIYIYAYAPVHVLIRAKFFCDSTLFSALTFFLASSRDCAWAFARCTTDDASLHAVRASVFISSLSWRAFVKSVTNWLRSVFHRFVILPISSRMFAKSSSDIELSAACKRWKYESGAIKSIQQDRSNLMRVWIIHGCSSKTKQYWCFNQED